MKITVEHTDTFAGEANYDWVKRHSVELKDSASRLSIVRKAKALCGFNGIRAKVYDFGDMIQITPNGYCQTCFVTFDYD